MILWIPSRLPGLNELLNAKGTVRGAWNGYNEQKCMWYGRVKLLCLARGIGIQPPGFLTMLYLEKDRRRDPDNVVAGGTKLLLDSLVGAGVLRGDGWDDNLGFIGFWTCRKGREGCLVHWGDELLTKQAMEALLEKEISDDGRQENATSGNANGYGSGAFGDGARRANASKRQGRRRAK